jgi:succinate dehydrogenase/fumarate reductase flavoprotein subunit
VTTTGGRIALTAGNVVFAGGGYSANAAWRQRYMPAPTPRHTAANAGNDATTLDLAMRLGAVLGERRSDNAWWFPCSVVRRDDGSEGVFPHIILDRAKPGVMAVDRRGRRFVNEGVNYHQFCLAQYAHDAVPCWLVCDDACLRRYGLGAVRPGGRSIADWIRRGYLTSAPTLAALAVRIGVAAHGLETSAARMSDFSRTGRDLEFGKGDDAVSRQSGDPARAPNPCLGAVATPPFYAVEVAPADLGTSLGVVANENAQLLDGRGVPIPGLYACGNDMDSIMSDRYPAPGTTLGPAMTFGYRAALHIAGRSPPQ